MQIVILGAGQVGTTVAKTLAKEGNELTVVDASAENLRHLQDHLDLRIVHGQASHPSVLRRAGLDDAEMLLAVTASDETNMIACQVAHTVFNTPTKIARIRAPAYTSHASLFAPEALPVDVIISPEQLVTHNVRRLIEVPGALQVLDFAKGKVRLVAVKAYYGGPLVGHALRALRNQLPNIDSRVAAIFRRGVAIVPDGGTVIEADDEVFFVAATEHIRAVMGELRKLERPTRRIMLAGGGNIGYHLALGLENQSMVKLIETNYERSLHLSEALRETIVLHGSAVDEELLQEEKVRDMDVFCAITNDDQVNILSAMLAKRLGARKVMALINRQAYVELVEGHLVDVAISPQQSTISALLAHIRRGDVAAVHSLRHGATEALEAIAHGTRHTSGVVGRRVGEIKLPPGTTIDAVVRGDEVMIAHHNTMIENNDHVILFMSDKRSVTEVENLFKVGFRFL